VTHRGDAAPVVYLLDGHVYIFRAYHSLPPMQAPDGTPTQAVYGFANTLLKFLADPAVTHLGVCFDAGMQSFRNEIEPGYKAQRGDPPADLEQQFPLCAEAARAIGLPVYERERFEADDVIATLAERLVEAGARVVVVTTDKDLSQLVREDGRISMLDLARELVLDADGVRDKFGVDPAQIPDYLGLVGDAVDNLPGVPGVGPKSAAAALAAFGRIEDVPADPEQWSQLEVRGAARLAARIEAHRERALLTKQLATVRRDVPGLRAELRDFEVRGAHPDTVDPFFERLGWGRIRDRISRWQDSRIE